MTLTEYLDEWIERQRLRLQPATWAAYRLTLDCYIFPALGREPLSCLDPLRLEQLYIDLLEHGGRDRRPLSLRTVRYIHAVLHKALADAVRTGVLASNVSDRATLPRVDPRRGDVPAPGMQVWTAAQARRFLDLTTGDPHRDLWATALGTGMRRGELLGLRWSDVIGNRQLRVASSLAIVDGRPRLKSTKTNRVRHLHLDARTAAAVQRRRAVQDQQHGEGWHNALDLVFTDEVGAALVPQRTTHRFRRLVRRLDVPTIRLHDLRHTHATLLQMRGVAFRASFGGLCDCCAGGDGRVRRVDAAGEVTG